MATLPNPLPTLASSGLDLPPGALVDATMDGPWHEPLLWYADGPAAAGVWAAMRTAGRPLGLLPVLVDGGPRGRWPQEWDLCPEITSYPGDHDAEDVLAGYWTDYADDEIGGAGGGGPAAREGGDAEGADRDPGPWPGLAPVPHRTAGTDPDRTAAEIADLLADGHGDGSAGPRIALVPARRSADIPAAIGWSGPLNHDNDVARLCAVLRSWEDRYDLRVLMLGPDTMTVSVGRPPSTAEEARALAAEHYAFCPDTIDQNPPYDLDAYAEKRLLGQEVWSFWWD
ncbi:hypothetical protein EES43_12040 [Streptomyces sp. ADI96-02]|uniref:DUF4253 domain-containing protein n=1 Tax=unclassified Streptomyces TaxID=2593676 RepID=UPI000F552CAB|nr:DUF4253 domain-containing protein [Streptomyces sp. ADI96-02]RPK63257.1 hypothetical protein EES43_12040 [Streptomyces sp. ADI96-02]